MSCSTKIVFDANLSEIVPLVKIGLQALEHSPPALQTEERSSGAKVSRRRLMIGRGRSMELTGSQSDSQAAMPAWSIRRAAARFDMHRSFSAWGIWLFFWMVMIV